MPALVGYVRCNQEDTMENQPKLNSSKEVIAFLAERFPHCFSAEGEARPLKIGIFKFVWIVLPGK